MNLDQAYADLRNAIIQGANADKPRESKGVLGGVEDGTYAIEVSNTKGYVYARKNDGTIVRAFNAGAPIAPDLPVTIYETVNTTWVTVDIQRLPSFAETYQMVSPVALHTHDDPAQGLYDLVSGMRMRPGLIYVSSGLTIKCLPHWYWSASGQLAWFDGTDDLSLSGSVPGTVGYRCNVLAGIDRSTGLLTNFDSADELDDSEWDGTGAANIAFDQNFEPKAVIKLIYGQTLIGWRDFRDARPWASRAPRVVHADDNVSSPPTAAQLTTAFGDPADIGNDFIGILDDNGAGTTLYACFPKGADWFYAALTKAL
jgi:hypothetical protein